jgi:hypothetical protein
MEERRSDDDELDVLAGLVPVYLAMLGATIGGQLLGIGLCSLLGVGSIGLPIGCSVTLEAVVGARLGAAKSGGTLTPRQAARIGFTYSGALLAVSVFLLVWMEMARTSGGGAPSWTAGRAALALVLFAAATLARWGLMVALAPRAAR